MDLSDAQQAFAQQHVGGSTSVELTGVCTGWMPGPELDTAVLLAEGPEGLFMRRLYLPPSEEQLTERGAEESRRQSVITEADQADADREAAARDVAARAQFGRNLARWVGRPEEDGEAVLAALGKVVDAQG